MLGQVSVRRELPISSRRVRVRKSRRRGIRRRSRETATMNHNGDRDASEYLLRVVEQVPSMLAYWDKDLICRYANRAYQRWFGKDPAALLGTSIRDLLGPELFALNEPYILGALRGEEQ